MLSIFQQITPKDWLLLVIGSLAPIMIFLFRSAVEYQRNAKKMSPILGLWHSYHWSRFNFEPKFRYTRLKFTRSLFGLHVEEVDDHNTISYYRGSIEFQGSHIILTCQGVSHPETWQARLPAPIPPHGSEIMGIELMQDFSHEIAATIKLCSRWPLTEEEAKTKILTHYQPVSEEAAIRVQRQSSG